MKKIIQLSLSTILTLSLPLIATADDFHINQVSNTSFMLGDNYFSGYKPTHQIVFTQPKKYVHCYADQSWVNTQDVTMAYVVSSGKNTIQSHVYGEPSRIYQKTPHEIITINEDSSGIVNIKSQDYGQLADIHLHINCWQDDLKN